MDHQAISEEYLRSPEGLSLDESSRKIGRSQSTGCVVSGRNKRAASLRVLLVPVDSSFGHKHS